MLATFTPRSLASTPRLAAARSASEAEGGDPRLGVTEVVCDLVAQGALDLAGEQAVKLFAPCDPGAVVLLRGGPPLWNWLPSPLALGAGAVSYTHLRAHETKANL